MPPGGDPTGSLQEIVPQRFASAGLTNAAGRPLRLTVPSDDGLGYEEQGPGGVEPDEVTRTLTGAHFYRSMAIFDKGVNEEGPSPSWIPRTRMSHQEMSEAEWGGDGLRATVEE